MRPSGLVWQLQANLTLIEADRESNMAYSKSLSTLHERLLVGPIVDDLLLLSYVRWFVVPVSLSITALVLVASCKGLPPSRDLWVFLPLLVCMWVSVQVGDLAIAASSIGDHILRFSQLSTTFMYYSVLAKTRSDGLTTTEGVRLNVLVISNRVHGTIVGESTSSRDAHKSLWCQGSRNGWRMGVPTEELQ